MRTLGKLLAKFLANNLPKMHNSLNEPNQIRGIFNLKKTYFLTSVFDFQNCFKNISDVLRYAKHGTYGLRMTWIFWILNKKIFGKKIRFYASQVMLVVTNSHFQFSAILEKFLKLWLHYICLLRSTFFHQIWFVFNSDT